MKKMKILVRQSCMQVQRMRNILAILALFVCTSICLGQPGQTIDIVDNNNGCSVTGNADKNNKGRGEIDKDPSGNTVNITEAADNIGHVFGAFMNDDIVRYYGVRIDSTHMTGNKVNVFDLNPGYGKFDDTGDVPGRDIYGASSERATVVDVNDNKVEISGGFNIMTVYGGRAKKGIVSSNTVTISSSVEIGRTVYGGFIDDEDGKAIENKVKLTDVVVKQNVLGARIKSGLASSNTVTIISGAVQNVYGGYIQQNGTATLNTVTIISGAVQKNVYGGYIVGDGTATGNKVNLTSVTVSSNVFGARIGKSGISEKDGYASSNTVTITGGRVDLNVVGGYVHQNGTATLNTVDMTRVTVSSDVYGAKIDGSGLASNNTVIIKGDKMKIGGDVFGGYVKGAGKAIHNTITITGEPGLLSINKIEGNVFGGYVKGAGEATHNTITITGDAGSLFSYRTILCGGICGDTARYDVFTGNTLNIETKGVEVKGISNFENYEFHLKDVKPKEVILRAMSGGCSWDVGEYKYTPDCAVDLSRSNIILHAQGVLDKGEYSLIRSPKEGFKDDITCKKFVFDNRGLIEYSWEIKISDNKRALIAKLTDKKIRDEGVAKSLLEGNGAGIVCINNGMDCIINKMEETESLLGEGAKLQRKGEMMGVGVFYGLAANKSSYNTDKESHVDMNGMSMMGGIVIADDLLRGKEGSSVVFAEYGDIHCEKKNEGKSNYVGGGAGYKYNFYEDEFRETKLYGEVILRIGQVNTSFKSKEAKDSTGKEYEYDDKHALYVGGASGVGYKHKVSDKIDLDYSLRYMFGGQKWRDVERVDADGNGVNFEGVKSDRIRVGVKGKYVELEKIKPYAGIRYEHELDGKVEGAITNGSDEVDIPALSFGGGTGIVEVGASGKVWKFDVGISGQGCVGARKGIGGMLKVKYEYAFGKNAHAKPQPKDKEKETAEKGTAEFERRSS